MNKHGFVRVERNRNVARVVLNRPELHNAFDDVMIGQLTKAAQTLAADSEIRLVILRSEGKSFCAGADLNWMQRMVAYTEKENLADATALATMFEAWDALPQPVLGRIHGPALGGGVGLVAVCDIAVAASSAVFAFSEVRLGIVPAVISPFVMHKIGVSAARELFLTGSRFTAMRAKDIGLVHHVADAGALDEEVDALTRALLAGGADAQRRMKALVRTITGLSAVDARPHTTAAIAAARVGAEGQEGLRAFLERRSPTWREES